MSQELIKQVVEGFQKDFSDFKKDNDAKLADLAKKGAVDPLLEEKLEKSTKGLEALEKKLEEVQTAIKRTRQEDSNENDGEKIRNEIKSAFNSWARKGGESYFTQSQEFKTLSVSIPADGGFAVLPEQSNQMGAKVFESSPMRELASVVTISSDSFEELYDNDEPDATRPGELSTRSATATNELQKIKIFAHLQEAYPKASLNILEDANFNIEAWHAQKVREKFGRMEATDHVSGTGVNCSKGILSYTAGDGFDKIEQVASGVSGEITADSLIDLQGTLFERFQPNAHWMLRRATMNTIRKLKDGMGKYLFSLEGNLADGFKPFLIGAPARYAADMPAVGSNALAVAYGDFKAGYLIVDRAGISVLRNPFSAPGFVSFYTRRRTGGGVRQFQAIKLLKLAASV